MGGIVQTTPEILDGRTKPGQRIPMRAWKRNEVRAAIIQNPNMSAKHLTKLLPHVSLATIARCRRELVAEGIIKRYRGTPLHGPSTPKSHLIIDQEKLKDAEESEAEIDARIKAGTLNWQDIERIVSSSLARNRDPESIAKLSRAFALIKQQTGNREELGPGPPLGWAAKVERVFLLMNALPQELVDEAYQRAYGASYRILHAESASSDGDAALAAAPSV